MNEKDTVGVDVAKKTFVAVRFSPQGEHEWFNGKTTVAGLNQFCSWLSENDDVFLEAGSQAFFIARFLAKNAQCSTAVLNAAELATIYASLKKTDKEDALKIARLAYSYPQAYLPTVNVPTEDQEAMRSLATEQAHYASIKIKCLNRLHSLFHKVGYTTITKTDLRSHKGRLKCIDLLPPAYFPQAVRLVRHIQETKHMLNALQKEMNEYLRAHRDYTRLVMSMPGIGPITAFTLLAFLSDCRQFKNRKQLSYYVGFVPRIYISGNSKVYGRIHSRGCRPVRRVIVQSAWALVRSDHGGDLQEFYNQLSVRRGRRKAVIALARKMLTTLFSMIKSGEQYWHMPDDLVTLKLAKNGI